MDINKVFKALSLFSITVLLTSCMAMAGVDLSKYNTGDQSMLNVPFGPVITPAPKVLPKIKKFPLKLSRDSWQRMGKDQRNMFKKYFHRKGKFPIAEIITTPEMGSIKTAMNMSSGGGYSVTATSVMSYDINIILEFILTSWEDKDDVLIELESEAMTEGTLKYTTKDGIPDTAGWMKDISTRSTTNSFADLLEKLDDMRDQIDDNYSSYKDQ